MISLFINKYTKKIKDQMVHYTPIFSNESEILNFRIFIHTSQ